MAREWFRVLKQQERVYRIRNDGMHFHAGRLPNGNRVLMGLQHPEVVCVEFDSAGRLLTLQVRPSSIPHQPGATLASIEDLELLEDTLRTWQTEIGFTPSTIAVRPFFLADRWIGISDLPEHYQDVKDRPEDFDDEERRILEGELRLWRESGNFVLYWAEDYYLSKDGELESS